MQITVSFEEMPSFIINGADSGFVEGEATIEFDREGQWDVTGIKVIAYGKKGSRTERLDSSENPSVYCCLVDAITDRMARTIESDIDDYFANERAYAADTAADARREMMAAE